MERRQETEWFEAQKIVISQDLVAAAKQQLQFLAAVDRRRWLYDGRLLDYAIFRYKAFWLPLLAKHTEDGAAEGSLYVPLDCEWIWHCHRLNPVQYSKDCRRVFGKILNNHNVKSSLHGQSKLQMAELWSKLYSEEPFELNFDTPCCDKVLNMDLGANISITYDLVSAVKRQSSFFYQVSRPWMHDDRFLEEALARYKGFLYLIKTNHDKSLKRFCVPTYDIDLMWHSHQLHPASYCKDMVQLLGRVLEHDDTDSDRSKGKKLDNGFTGTLNQWEDTFGLRYWRAGTMYKGTLPSPLTVTPYISDSEVTKEYIHDNHLDLALTQLMVVEVLLEVIGIKDLPDTEKGNLYVSFSKNLPDAFFIGTCNLGIKSESGKKQVASFKCEPTGELILSLMSKTNSGAMQAKTIGTSSISLKELMNPNHGLSMQRWIELTTDCAVLDSKPVSIHFAASFTAPIPAPCILRMFKSPTIADAQLMGGWTHFLDQNGRQIISLKMRDTKKAENSHKLKTKLEVIAITRESKEVNVVAECVENNWRLIGSNASFTVENEISQDGHIYNIEGDYKIKLFPGKKLEYEPKSKQLNGSHFVTVVEFTTEHPYGKALALFNMKDGLIEVNEDWFALPGIILAFILKRLTKKDGNDALIDATTLTENNIHKTNDLNVEAGDETNVSIAIKAASNGASGCGSGCGGGCGGCGAGMINIDNSAGGCGAGCSGACGGCGGGLMNVENSAGGCGGGCGGGCAGGCGMMKSDNAVAGCGAGCGGCGGGCGMMKSDVAAGGCGSCGGGCGNGLAGDQNVGSDIGVLTGAGEDILVSA